MENPLIELPSARSDEPDDILVRSSETGDRSACWTGQCEYVDAFSLHGDVFLVRSRHYSDSGTAGGVVDRFLDHSEVVGHQEPVAVVANARGVADQATVARPATPTAAVVAAFLAVAVGDAARDFRWAGTNLAG